MLKVFIITNVEIYFQISVRTLIQDYQFCQNKLILTKSIQVQFKQRWSQDMRQKINLN